MSQKKASPGWMYQQSGVIPYRFHNNSLQILLITNRKREHWIVPKGIIEADMSPQESAITEAWEEAGISGRIGEHRIGYYYYKKWGGTCQVEVYLFEVNRVFFDWPEAGMRDREWVSLPVAIKQVHRDGLRKLLRRVPDHLTD